MGKLEIRTAAMAFAALYGSHLAAQQTAISGKVSDPSAASIAAGVVTATGDDASK